MGGSAEYREAHKQFQTTGFGHGTPGTGNGKGDDHFPVEANVRIKEKTVDGALAEFRKQHANSDHEWAYVIDDQGYVHEYDEGDSSSVAVYNSRNGRVIHNHPTHGEPAFSYEDLELFAKQQQKSITASSPKYDYTVERGTHFKKDEFVKALSKAKLVGRDYNDAVHNWLLANAGKYGYKYTRNTYKKDGSLGKTQKSTTLRKGKKQGKH